MKKHSVFLITGVLLLVVLSSCGLPASGTGSEGGSTGGEGSTSPSGNCANPLLPVVLDASWNFKSTESVIGEYDLSYTVSNAGSDGFTFLVTYSTGVSVSQDWSCDSGNLTQIDTGGGVAGTLSTNSGLTSEMVTENVVGVTLPAVVAANDTWTLTQDISSTTNLPDGSVGTVEGSYSTTFTAVGTEQVTVVAGTFNAMRIQAEQVFDMIVHAAGFDVPTTITNSSTFWYAQNVGIVKMINVNDFETETIELQSYFIP